MALPHIKAGDSLNNSWQTSNITCHLPGTLLVHNDGSKESLGQGHGDDSDGIFWNNIRTAFRLNMVYRRYAWELNASWIYAVHHSSGSIELKINLLVIRMLDRQFAQYFYYVILLHWLLFDWLHWICVVSHLLIHGAVSVILHTDCC